MKEGEKEKKKEEKKEEEEKKHIEVVSKYEHKVPLDKIGVERGEEEIKRERKRRRRKKRRRKKRRRKRRGRKRKETRVVCKYEHKVPLDRMGVERERGVEDRDK